MEATAVNKGWNAMMDESYLNITMKSLGRMDECTEWSEWT